MVLQGDFARAQAEYLQPDLAQVDGLVQALSSKKIGIVAHFYMDPQVGQLPPHVQRLSCLLQSDAAC